MTTIHQSMPAGRLNASSRPVTTADRSPTVLRPRSMNRWIAYSNTTQLRIETAVMSNTLNPNTHVETTRAGISARMTSAMIPRVVVSPWTCGDGETKNLFAIISLVLSFYFLAARARMIPMTVCLPRRI